VTDPTDSVPLAGYSDRLSVRPGEAVSFKVSSTGSGPVSAWLTRSICADPNPAGMGVTEERRDDAFPPQEFPARYQPFYPGSYAITEGEVSVPGEEGFTLQAVVFPTLLAPRNQTVLAVGPAALFLDAAGAAAARVGDISVSTGVPLSLRFWYQLEARYDAAAGRLSITQTPIDAPALPAHEDSAEADTGITALSSAVAGPVTIAAAWRDGKATEHFNGKIERPAIYGDGGGPGENVIGLWDFTLEVPSTVVGDIGPNGLDARLVNYPARAMTGSAWDASEMCWRHAPDHYGAIHFHEDDIYDFGWETDFSFTVPEELESGVYVMRLRCGDAEDAMPFFVCPPRGTRTADVCYVAPTFTYAIYGNHARPDFEPSWRNRIAEWQAYPHNPADHRSYGLSTYNYHTDGSGICHASHRRPLFNLRPGYLTFCTGTDSGLRHFQADSHLISWLHAMDIAYDVVTDRELHEEGGAVLQGYKAVLTASHPEYHTRQSLDAFLDYRNSGGNLSYLGGNGFYWRVALHEEDEGIVEIRRGEGGIRAWASEPGEYYNAFDGAYGGLWRRSGRPPQQIAGVGFSAQGQFNGSYYRRLCRDSAYDWVFEGVDDEILGDFGFSGGGAAGFELDRCDVRLGSPANAVVLASSEGHGEDFILVPEEQLTHLTNIPGEPVGRLLRADMVYFDVPGGGSVFSTGSITFCGSLPWNKFDNNISRILENVVRRAVAQG